MKVDLGIVRCLHSKQCLHSLHSKQYFCDFRAVSGAFWGPFACCKISAMLPGALGFTCSSPISPNFSLFCCFDTVSTSLSVTGMADSNNDVFRMLSAAAEDKLDGDSNYPLWAYMMQHVLVSKGVWNIVQGFRFCRCRVC